MKKEKKTEAKITVGPYLLMTYGKIGLMPVLARIIWDDLALYLRSDRVVRQPNVFHCPAQPHSYTVEEPVSPYFQIFDTATSKAISVSEFRDILGEPYGSMNSYLWAGIKVAELPEELSELCLLIDTLLTARIESIANGCSDQHELMEVTPGLQEAIWHHATVMHYRLLLENILPKPILGEVGLDRSLIRSKTCSVLTNYLDFFNLDTDIDACEVDMHIWCGAYLVLKRYLPIYNDNTDYKVLRRQVHDTYTDWDDRSIVYLVPRERKYSAIESWLVRTHPDYRDKVRCLVSRLGEAECWVDDRHVVDLMQKCCYTSKMFDAPNFDRPRNARDNNRASALEFAFKECGYYTPDL
jgi:hypothetical protein